MFLARKPIITVVIRLGLSCEEVQQYYFEYLSLNDLDNFVKIIKDHSHFLPFLYDVAEKVKSHEFDESDVNILIHYMNDAKTLINIRNKVQHEVNMLTVKRDDLL